MKRTSKRLTQPIQCSGGQRQQPQVVYGEPITDDLGDGKKITTETAMRFELMNSLPSPATFPA